MNRREVITNENMICMAYCRKAIISPTCMLPLSIRMPPAHTITILVKFITSIIMGSIDAFTILTLMAVEVSSLFASPNRFFSWPMRLKARITRIPVRFSRSTRLSLSSFTCIALKSGMPLRAIIRSMPARSGSTTTKTSERVASLDTAIIIPPIHISGALIIIRKITIRTCCSCVISLVVRVIREAVPIVSNSCNVYSSTWEKTLLRRSLANPVAIFAERNPAIMENITPPNATRSINPPTLKI